MSKENKTHTIEASRRHRPKLPPRIPIVKLDDLSLALIEVASEVVVMLYSLVKSIY